MVGMNDTTGLVSDETPSDFADSTKPDNQDDDELHRKIVKNIRECRTHFSDWRKESREDYDFFAGRQWDDDDIAILQEQGRPAVTFNRTARTINSVAGLEVQNRQEVRFYPRQLNNSGTSEILSGAAKWVRDECNAEDEESEAFQDSLICGMGWTETRLDYETNSQGQILIDRLDPIECFVDQTSKKRNCDDSRFRGRIRTYSVEEFKTRFPGAEIPQGRFFDTEEDQKLVQDLTPAQYSPTNDDLSTTNRRLIQVCHYQYFEVYKVRVIQDANGKTIELPEGKFKERQKMMDSLGWKYTNSSKPKRRYWNCFLSPDDMLEKEEIEAADFTLHVITGLRDRNKNTWFGIVRMMKDPQRWANKWLSQIQHILNTQAKSGKLLYETGAFKNPGKAKSEWASPDAMAELNAGGIEKIQQIPAAQYPEGIDRLLEYALSAINDVPGVNLELMGLANRDQPNVLEQSRKQAGVTILAVFFDSLRRYRKTSGRVLAAFIRLYISDGRLVRISGPLGQQYVQLLRDPEMIEYDVVVDDAPTSTNMKERTFAALQAIMPMVLQAQIPVPPDLLDYTPFPEDLIQKWKQYIAGQSQNPDVLQKKQMAMESGTAEIQHTKSQAVLNTAKAQKELYDLQNPPDNTLDMQKSAADLQLRREQMLQENALKREQMGHDLNLKREDMLLGHHVNLEGKRMQADASSKPTVTQQLGSDGAIIKMTETLGEITMEGQKLLGEMMLKGFESMGHNIGNAIIAGDERLATALTASKRIVKDKQGKPIGIEVVH